jgi:hypothetical protein
MKHAEWLTEFGAKRWKLKAEPLAVIAPELTQELAIRFDDRDFTTSPKLCRLER